jgi:hypothetical protein
MRPGAVVYEERNRRYRQPVPRSCCHPQNRIGNGERPVSGHPFSTVCLARLGVLVSTRLALCLVNYIRVNYIASLARRFRLPLTFRLAHRVTSKRKGGGSREAPAI